MYDNIDIKLMWSLIILVSLYILYRVYQRYLGEQTYSNKIKSL